MSKTLSFFDSHCHLDRYPDLENVLKRARENGVRNFLSICVSQKNFSEILPFLETPDVYASVGLHPCYIQETLEQDSIKAFSHQLTHWLIQQSRHKKIVALGETGLDQMPESGSVEDQLSVFRAHVQAAEETDLPLIVHMRKSEEIFLQEMENIEKTLTKPLRGVMHCFTGSLACAQRMVQRHWFISISGIVTYKNAAELRQTISMLPLHSLLLETDAPWLAPQGHRGHANEPAFLIETAQMVAQIHGISLESLADVTRANTLQLFSKISA